MGTGGVGGYFGGLLARSGEDVTFVARGAQLQALQSGGLQVRSAEGDFTLPVRATDRPEEAGHMDLVLFTVKTYDVETAAEALRPAVGPETAVLCLQNGVDTEDYLVKVLGGKHVLGGVTYVGVSVEAPGIIHHAGLPGTVIFGEMDGQITPRVQAIEATLREARIKVEVTNNIVRVLWEKFVAVCANGGVTAITRVSLGEAFAHRESREMYRGLMEETVSVGKARGIDLNGVVDRHMAFFEDQARSPGGPHIRSSLYHDLVAGRRMELDSLSGAVVRMGREMGVPTPLSFAVVAALRPHQRIAEAVHTSTSMA